MSSIVNFIKSSGLPGFTKQVVATVVGLGIFFFGLFAVVSGTMADAVDLVKEEMTLLSAPREWHPGEDGILHVSLGESFTWRPPSSYSFILSLGEHSRTSSLPLLREALDKAATDPCVKAVVIEAEKAKAGFATLEEVRSMIAKFRAESLKPVAVVTSAAALDERDFFLFADVDFLYAAPGSAVALTGMVQSGHYVKELLDNLGIMPFFARSDQHKTFGEEFERTESSEQRKAVIKKALEYKCEHVFATIANGHRLSQQGITRKSLDEIPSAHPFLFHTEAAERKLICLGGFYDAFFRLVRTLDGEEEGPDSEPEASLQPASTLLADPADLKAAALADLQNEQGLNNRVAPKGSGVKLIPLFQYATHIPVLDDKDHKDQIGVAVLEGKLTDTKSSLSSSPSQVAKQIRQYGASPHIKAVVLIVNSPGGTISPTLEIANSIEKVKKVKPVVVHGVDYAASGGYWMATPADWIVMDPYAITGSIGAFSGEFSLRDALGKIGIRQEVIHKTHPYSDMDIHDEQVREMLIKFVQECERHFCEAVAKGRGLPLDHVSPLAGGQVWLAEEAVANQLIDQVGTFQDAVAKAAQLAGLAEGEYKLIFAGERFEDFLIRLRANLSRYKPFFMAGADSHTAAVFPENLSGLTPAELIQLMAQLLQCRSQQVTHNPSRHV